MSRDVAPPITDAERQELLALYQVSTQDLAFFKSQQWALTNYALVSLAAIVAAAQFDAVTYAPCIRLLLCVAAVLIAVVAIALLWRLHGSIVERRARLRRVYARLTETFRDARGTKQSVSPWEMMLPLWGLISGGTVLTCWLVACAV